MKRAVLAAVILAAASLPPVAATVAMLTLYRRSADRIVGFSNLTETSQHV